MLKIINGMIYDPLNNKNGKEETLWVKEDKIIEPPSSAEIERAKEAGELEVIDAQGMAIMPGGIDIHTHIAGPKINTGRVLRPEDHRGDTVSKRENLRSGVGSTVPTTFVTGYRYAGMGYTTVMEAAGPPLKARHVHEEFEDLPFVDKGFLVLAGNNYFVMKFISEGDKEALKNYLAWLIVATGAFGLKVVNPGGVEAWKEGKDLRDMNESSGPFNLSPKEVLEGLAEANEDLGLPHPIHVHTNNLGHAGNYRTTLETLDLLKDYRAHITHVQFSSYGEDEENGLLTSESGVIADKINELDGITVDIGQIIFGDATTMTADGPLQYGLHQLSGNKWVNTDVEMETGSGVVPLNYKQKNLVNGIQWAIGLELFLKIEDPWKVFLTTDHPNAGPFTAYPWVIKLLMDADYRQEMIFQLHPKVSQYTDLAGIDREYTLEEIAVITRAGPASALGLKEKGNLAIGNDADIVIYNLAKDDLGEVFAKPEWVIKDGKTVVQEGELVDELIDGRTLLTKPEYDENILDIIEEDFKAYYSISLENYSVADDYFKEIEVIPCR